MAITCPEEARQSRQCSKSALSHIAAQAQPQCSECVSSQITEDVSTVAASADSTHRKAQAQAIVLEVAVVN